MPLFIALFLLIPKLALGNINILQPVKTENPQATMKTFIEAMNRYHEGIKERDSEKIKSIDKAIRTLDLSQTSPLLRYEVGKKSSVYLKEVLDRVIVIEYDRIPPGHKTPPLEAPFWRLKNTEITIRQVAEGPRKGEWLFSQDTIERSKSFYQVVKHLPYLKGTGQGAGFKDNPLEGFFPSWLKTDFFNVPGWQILGIFVTFILGFLIKWIAEKALIVAKKIAQKSRSQLDDRMLSAIEGPLGYSAASAFWFICLYILRLEGVLFQGLSLAIQFVFSISIIWIFYRLADVWTDYIALLAKKTDFVIDDQLVPLLSKALRTFIVIFGGLIAVQNLGINVMSVVAGLGLGGLAFALAAKDTAANLFGSLMILWDRPFKIGDWIVFNNVEGTVEDVGFRSTRIRTFYNSLVTVPNAVVANCNIDNMGHRKYRRVKTTIGIKYDTSPDKITSFTQALKKTITSHPCTNKNNFHIVFNDYGGSALNILVYFFLDVGSWQEELLEREAIFIEFMKIAHNMGIEFAFPTQTLHLESIPKSGIALTDLRKPSSEHRN